MSQTDHDLLRWTTSHTLHKLRQRRDDKWHTGDEYDKIEWRIRRLERWHEYVKLDKEFSP